MFDTPYFDLRRAPTVRGLVDWGAHDPGTRSASRPGGIAREIRSRFGPYPAAEWIYGSAWPSPNRARAMADALTRAVDLRAGAARWLLRERLPDWDLSIVVVSELHSAIEGLWHGVDDEHPLHHVPSAPAAGDGLRAVYRASDHLVADLVGAFPDATAVVFATGGMGPNRSDAPSMLLLPELLYRHAFDRKLFRAPADWANADDGTPTLPEHTSWSAAVNTFLPNPATPRKPPSPLAAVMRRVWSRVAVPTGPVRLPLDWMPATRYQRHWRRMPAFALPSFYDGRIRINLIGREHHGLVPLDDYKAVCDEIEDLLRSCRDPRTGEGVVDTIERHGEADPRSLTDTQSDLIVVWRGMPLALEHPEHGLIGPVPFRRPGGHTGRYGVAYISGADLKSGDHGVRGTLDVVPTIVDLLGEQRPSTMSGSSLLSA